MIKNHVMNTYGRADIIFEKGMGTKLYDTEGKEYLDFVSGIAVNCLGHSNPVIVNAIKAQSEKLMHVSNYYWNEYNIKLSNILIENSDHDSVFFTNSGAEALEGAMKLCRKYGKTQSEDKDVILYLSGSFHGRTMGAISITGQPAYQKPFMPIIPNTVMVEFNSVEDLKEKFTSKVCGIILEPVQGEGGLSACSMEFLQTAKDLCEKNNALLVFDEVQCGIGRLGTLFAYEKFGVVPDVICIAKALGGGVPIGAFIANEKTSNVLVPGDHGTTYGGNPFVCAVACAVLDELINNGVIKGIDAKSDYMKGKLLELKEKYPSKITEIKGMGLLIGFKLEGSPKEFMAKALEKGLLVIYANNNVVRLLPPLNVTEEEIDAAIELLDKVFSEF